MNTKQTEIGQPQQEYQPMLPFEITSIEDQSKRGWELSVNDAPVEDVSHAELRHEKMGISVKYGKRPEGYDGFVIREPGGAATMPYMIAEDGGIYVGVVTEYRPTMGEEKTDNIPRGFSDFKSNGELEDAETTATREMQEETGYRTLGRNLITLAEGMNPNSTFFDYSHDKKEGVSIFALPVKQDDLELQHDNDGNIYYAFPATIRDQAETDKAAERILGSKFIPLQEALRSRDMFTSAAAGQLMAHLLDQGEYLVPQNTMSK